ncbi:MAG TPA: hypothetical protein VFY61_09360 [Pyrinomonadaceae bacterium]|nr:hypothetical protein [Pyrinomonadaceae bacterium]
MKMPSNLMQLRVIAFSMVLIIVPFFVYYYFFVSNQTKYFNGRNLRTLATLSNHIQESADSQGNVFKNAVEKYIQDSAQRRSDKLETPLTAKDLVQNGHNEFQEKQLSPLRNEGPGPALEATNLSIVSKPEDGSLPSAPRIEVKEESNQSWLYFDYTVQYPPVSKGPAASNRDSKTKPASEATTPAKPIPVEFLNFKARVNLVQLIGPFVNKREMQENRGSLYHDGFDAVLIAGLDEQMTILFQESSQKLRMVSLSSLTSATGAKVDLKLLGQSANISDVRLGPADYKLFVQPVQLPLLKAGAKNQESVRWLACGLVENLHFQQQRLAISYNVLIAFGFITALLAVSWAFLKLVFIGPKDRFRAVDGYMLGVSAFMIVALLTIIALFTYGYNATLNQVDGNLKQFAGSLKANFFSELKDALRQIDYLNCTLDAETIEAADKASDRNLDKLTLRSSILNTGEINSKSPYPFLQTAFWVNEKGSQQMKWTVRSSVTNRVDVSTRPYFKQLKHERQYTLKDDNGKTHEFWIEPVTAKTTGVNTVIVSKRAKAMERLTNIARAEAEANAVKRTKTGGASKPANGTVPKSLWVSAIDIRFISLMQPVIPEGFGYAVIDDNGKVLFHSAEKLHLGENLFEECDNNQALKAAVLGRWSKSLTSSYFGKGHSIYVEPMGNFSWTIVAFSEKDSLRTTFFEILTLCLLLFLSYVIVLCLLLLGIYLINYKSDDRTTWLWPDEHKRSFYVGAIAVNSVLFLLSCFAVSELRGLWKLGLPTLIGLGAVALTFWRFKRAQPADEQEKPRWFDYRTAYVVNVTLLFCLASILPAYACFKIAYVQEMKLFIKHGQLNLAKLFDDREARIRTQSIYVYRNTAQEKVDALVKRRTKEERDLYYSFFFETKQRQQDALETYTNAPPSRLLAFFKGFVPLFDNSSVSRHALTDMADDNSRRWDDFTGTSLVLHAREPQPNGPGKTERRIESHLPRLSGLSWWLMLPLVFLAASMLVYYMIRQLFLFAREQKASDELTELWGKAVSPNLLLVLGQSFIGKRQLLKRIGENGGNRIDFRDVAQQESWLKQVELLQPDVPVVLDNFDHAIDESQRDENKLGLLKALRENNRRTIALSTIDQERLLLPNGINGHTNGNGNDPATTLPVPVLSERWIDEVSHFLRVEPGDVGDAKSFSDALGGSKERLLATPDLDEKARERIEASFKLIATECWMRAYLQNIGRAVANQSQLAKVSAADLYKQIMINARPYYTSIWNACSGEEKLTLTRLAQHGLLSPKDPDVDELLRKGLIVRDPSLRIMNESFRLFILSRGNDDAIAKCELDAKSSSNWEVLKVPLTIGLLSVGAFLLLTQRELYNSALPFLSGLAAGLPALLKLVSLFQSGSGAKAGS